jgi:hypothetical protein
LQLLMDLVLRYEQGEFLDVVKQIEIKLFNF